MDDHDSIFPDPSILWTQIREAERTAPEARPVVLVIEDDPGTRMVMRHAVRDVVRTDAAGSVADALRMAEAVPYDGLLVDLHLPDGDGTEVVEALRERTPYWGVPMVAVTAYSLSEEQGSFLAAGFDAYVAKPFEPAALRTLVHHLVVAPDEGGGRGRTLRRPPSAPEPQRDEAADAAEAPPASREAPATQSIDTTQLRTEDDADEAPKDA